MRKYKICRDTRNMSAADISTSQQFDATKYKTDGIVTVSHTEALSAGRGFVAGVAGIFGGKSDLMDKKHMDVLSALKTKLRDEIPKGGMLVAADFKVAVTELGEYHIFVNGFATATRLVPLASSGGSRTTQRRKTRRLRRR